jgi:hypothetical protein
VIPRRKTPKFWLLPLAFAAAAIAQTNNSNLDGIVKDQQGSLVPNAEVTVINTLTQQTFRSVTGNQGHWVIPSLPTASYSVTVTAMGQTRNAFNHIDSTSDPGSRLAEFALRFTF